jgi:hypothetical protein
MSQNEEVFTGEQRRVNRLIADAEPKRPLDNKELAETIAACIREAGERTCER